MSALYALLDELYDNGLHLVKYVVERDFRGAIENGYEKDDLVGYGVFGLLEACRKYNGSIVFRTFACKKIRQSVLSFIRQKCQKRYQYVDEIDVETHGRASLQNEYDYDDDDEKAYVRHIVKTLPEPHRHFVIKYYLEEMSVNEFREAFSVKKSRFFQLRTQSLALLRLKILDND